MKLKKPKFWDDKKPNIISYILYPFSKIFELITKVKPVNQKKFSHIKTICVGNIYIGGTGKTSLAIELKKILDEKKIKTCFVKKFYPDQFDEQNLLKKHGKVFVNRSRIKALVEAEHENYEVAIFDDGLQDNNIFYDLTFVCFNKKNLIGNGFLIPAGPLRQSLDSLKKYENIFLNGNDEDILTIESLLSKWGESLKFYEAVYQPNNLKDLDLEKTYIVFSGIGNHSTFIDMLKKFKFKITHDFEFPDHYKYSKDDIEKIKLIAKKNNSKILTTQKDFFRLKDTYKNEIQYIETYLKIKNIEKIKQKMDFFYESV